LSDLIAGAVTARCLVVAERDMSGFAVLAGHAGVVRVA
jgi:hypothetical protein